MQKKDYSTYIDKHYCKDYASMHYHLIDIIETTTCLLETRAMLYKINDIELRQNLEKYKTELETRMRYCKLKMKKRQNTKDLQYLKCLEKMRNNCFFDIWFYRDDLRQIACTNGILQIKNELIES